MGDFVFEADTDDRRWRLTVPPAMFLEQSEWGGRSGKAQVTVATFAMRSAVGPTGTLYSPTREDGKFPRGGVAFRLLWWPGSPGHVGSALRLDEASFPISFDTFEPTRKPDASDGILPSFHRQIAANGEHYFACVWIDPEATSRARSELNKVIESLRFPPLRTGEVVGIGFKVLELAEAYRVGSFTPIEVDEQPFVLVNAPGGFYALGWSTSRMRGYAATCDHEIDQDRGEIYCERCGARWDRIGRVITRPAAATRDDPLDIVPAKVAWDRHVLACPKARQSPSKPNARKSWPDWT